MATMQARSGLTIVLLAAASAGATGLLLRDDCGLWPGLCLALGAACFLAGAGAAFGHRHMSHEARDLARWLRKEGRLAPLHARAREATERRLEALRDHRRRSWSFVVVNACAGLLWSGAGALILALQRL